MAPRLVTWARNTRLGDDRAKHLLVLLADQASTDGICWPSLKTLIEDSEMAARTVQRKLAFLVRDGKLEVEDRRHARKGPKSNLYRLLADPEYLRDSGFTESAAALGDVRRTGAARATVARALTPKPGASPSATVALAHAPELGVRAHAKGGASYESPSLTSDSSEEEPERARSSPEFERTFAAWTANATGSTSWARALEEWNDSAPSVGPARLEAAAMAYLAESGDVRRHAPKALQFWLRDGDYNATLGRAPPSAPVPTPAWAFPARFPCEDIRSGVVLHVPWGGEAFAVSWLDGGEWDPETRIITAKSGLAFDRLSRELRGFLQAEGILLTRPGPKS